MNLVRPVITAIAMLVLLVGCGRLPGTITGDIDGDEVGSIRSAMFAAFETSAEEVVAVFASTTTNVCEHMTAQYEFIYDITDPRATVNDVKNGVADLADYINDNDLVGHWTFEVAAAADRRVDFRDANRISIDLDATVGSDRMAFFAYEQRRAPSFDQTEGYFSGQNVYQADQGQGFWSLDSDRGIAEVEGSVRLRDERGDRVGNLEFELYAEHCKPFQSIYADLVNR